MTVIAERVNNAYTALVEKDPLVAKLPLFDSILPGQRITLASIAQMVECSAGDSLFLEGDPAEGFFILVRGRVKMRKISSSGNEVILHLSSPPHMIGCKALTLPGSSYPADAVAVDDVRALRFTRNRFMLAVSEFPDVFFGLLVDLNRRLNEIYSLQSSLMEPMERRIAILLLQQALPKDANPEKWRDYPLFEVRLTKSLIASIVGSTTETAIRILSRWRKAGLIVSERGRIRIKQPEAVYKLTQG